MTYTQHMTDKYDPQFKDVTELIWDPWVGKNYHETGVFILGMSTDERNGPDWTLNLEPPLTSRDASRTIIANINKANDDPFQGDGYSPAFQKMAKMFIQGVGAQYDERTRAVFWEAVAFNNYYQAVLPEIGGIPEQKSDISKGSKKAFDATIGIIKPKIILAWTTKIWNLGLKDDEYETRDKLATGASPRVSKQTPPIIGIKHPAWDGGSEWLEFLRTDPASKKQIGEFLDYLKEQLS